MQEPSRWRRYLRFWGPDPIRDVDDELSFHLELKRQELRAAGVPPAELESALAREFGDRQRIERELREIGMKRLRRARRASVLDEVHVDLRHVWQSFRRRPGVPLLVVLILALAIGAGTAVFTLIDAVVLNPVPVVDAGDLLVLERRTPEGNRAESFSYPMLHALDEPGQHTTGVAGYYLLNVGTRSGTHVEQASAALVTGSYFDVLGVRPQAGRVLVPADDVTPGASPYVVVSEAFWRRALGADRDVIGRTLTVNEATLEIVGVAQSRFRGTALGSPVDLWIPLSMVNVVEQGSWPEMLSEWRYTSYPGIARVRSGSTAEAALSELTARHSALIEANWPERSGRRQGATVMDGVPLNEAAAGRSREDLMRFLRMLAAVVATCLAIACVNVANLLLMRATERTAEMSVRAALGGSRARLVRQLLMESLVLGLAAGAAGLLVGMGALRLLGAFALPGGISLEHLTPALDMRVFGFTAAVSLLCALLFGLAPAIAGSRANVMGALRQSSHGCGANLLRGGNALVSVQVALSLVLVVSALLFVRSLQTALSVDLGYRSQGIASVAVGLRQHGYDRERAAVFVNEAVANVVAQPGITAAAAATRVPIDPGAERMPLEPEGSSVGTVRSAVIFATPGYLDVLGVPFVRGRDIAVNDVRGSPQAAIITETAAEAMWPGEDALGRSFVIFFDEPWTVVGVVRDAHFTRLSDREPHVFLPYAQGPVQARLHLVARGDNESTVLGGLRAAVRNTDDRLPTFHDLRFSDQLNAVLMPQRFGGVLLGAFGIISLLISALGIYAVANYEVTRRHRELGIRAALGANARALTRAVVARSGVAILVGVIAGLGLAAVSTRGLRGLLFGITPYEPISYFAAAAALGIVATLASLIPARRAARVDPLTVIRE
jgi:predicted permease